jgi:hypothetical protein
VLNRDNLSTYNTKDKTESVMGLPIVSSRQPDATEVRIFLLEEEKTELKKFCESSEIPMSHLMRALALQWLEAQKKLAS